MGTTFAKNFLRRTTGSIVFWDRLTDQFVTETKTEIKDHLMDNLPDTDMEGVADTILDKLTSIMNMTANGDEASIRKLFEDIRGSNWDEAVVSYIAEVIADKLSSCNLATLSS